MGLNSRFGSDAGFTQADAGSLQANNPETRGNLTVGNSFLQYDGPWFKPKENVKQTIRIMQLPCGAAMGHRFFSYPVLVHFVPGGSYCCLAQKPISTPSKPIACPICLMRNRLFQKKVPKDIAKQYFPKCQNLMFVVDRKQEQLGPLLYNATDYALKQFISKIDSQAYNRVLPVTDWDEGHDMFFVIEKPIANNGQEGDYAMVSKVEVFTEKSPLHVDENLASSWIEKIQDLAMIGCTVNGKELPGMLKFVSVEEMEIIARQCEENPAGYKGKEDEEEEDDKSVRPIRTNPTPVKPQEQTQPKTAEYATESEDEPQPVDTKPEAVQSVPKSEAPASEALSAQAQKLKELQDKLGVNTKSA